MSNRQARQGKARRRAERERRRVGDLGPGARGRQGLVGSGGRTAGGAWSTGLG